MTSPGILIGFFAEREDAVQALRLLRTSGFRRSNLLHRHADGSAEADDRYARAKFAAPVAGALLGLAASLLPAATLLSTHPIWAIDVASVLVGLGAAAGRRYALRYLVRTAQTDLGSLLAWLLPDDTAIVVDAEPASLAAALNAMRSVTEVPPATFTLLGGPPPTHFPDRHATVYMSREQLTEHARRLSDTHVIVPDHSPTEPLLERLRRADSAIETVRRRLADASQLELGLSTSAEWLLDNAYIVQVHIEQVYRNLSRTFYHELPVLSVPPAHDAPQPVITEVPRAFALAQSLVDHTDVLIDRDSVMAFLTAYQESSSLTIGELWAMPLMLRIAIVVRLEQLATEIDRRLRDLELADLFANRLLVAARHDPGHLFAVLAEMTRTVPEPTVFFGAQLTGHLYDEDAALLPVQTWLERRLRGPIADLIGQEHALEGAGQVSIGNAITSLRNLSQMDWREVFEGLSAVERELRSDPSREYADMDFDTRNRYRAVVERMAAASKMPEEEVARQAVQLAAAARPDNDAIELVRHVGTYLLGDGRATLADRVGAVEPASIRFREALTRHNASFYVGLTVLLTLAFLVPVALVFLRTDARLATVVALFAASLPASQLAVQVVNYVVALVMPPRSLPKMSFESGGIPDAMRTLVVVPTLLADEATFADDAAKLETRYLANPDPNLVYALFGDFADSDAASAPDDERLVAAAVAAIRALESRYGPGRFMYLHRERDWCETEQRYIGWERKRGKLQELNALIVGEPIRGGAAVVRVGAAEDLLNITYVITLDGDTQLPRDSARRLVETIAHPLNRPLRHVPAGTPGRRCGIVQPRVSTSLPSAVATPFARIFTDATGTDPYSSAVSDAYQDLAGEASYHGKGIYDPRVFHRAVGDRFPDDRVLSHDLIEGAFVGVGLASDIELLDEFPGDYITYSRRQHRWIRGDWQIADWCLPWTPTRDGSWARNELSALNRWKVFDNLRRSLVPAGSVTLLLTAWSLSWREGLVAGALIALALLLWPTAQMTTDAIRSGRRSAFSGSELRRHAQRAIAEGALLPHQAGLALDAIVRVAYRRWVSRRRLLEWTSSQMTSWRSDNKEIRFLLHMTTVSALALGVSLVLLHYRPASLIVAAPFLALWLTSPLVGYRLVRGPQRRTQREGLTEKDGRYLRRIARKTWRFFDEFVGPDTQWLPPDNYQVSHQNSLAMRTSPTNIGLWMISALGAWDLGYLTIREVVDRLERTMAAIERLERHEGHLLNWYELEALRPLAPRYVSFVDSGNLLACLWTLEQGLARMIDTPVLGPEAMNGLQDTFGALQEALRSSGGADSSRRHVEEFAAAIKSDDPTPYEVAAALDRASTALTVLRSALTDTATAQEEVGYWLDQLDARLAAWDEVRSDVAPRGASTPLPPPDLARRIEALRAAVRALGDAMDMKPLYDRERRLFSVGLNVDEGRLDDSRYDLLMSEARLGSFVAIAREDVPSAHWLALGRLYRQVGERKVLLSWSGSMFEYLMPGLLQRSFDNSLLSAAAAMAVKVQIDYGRRRGVPWGISESAYGDLDAARTYQYQAFGVPELGLKRGLGDDLVIAPYATLLAVCEAPMPALANLRLLDSLGMQDLYGYFEAIDYGRLRQRGGERGVLVRAYMAHHQGMGFLSLVNLLTDGRMRDRFHADPRVKASEALLYERIPTAPALHRIDASSRGGAHLTAAVSPSVSRFDTPDTETVKTQLLSNGRYDVMVTGSGAGYSRWNGQDVTRWREDPSCDRWGFFGYVTDLRSGNVWSVGHQPTRVATDRYEVLFALDRAEIRRRDHGIECDATIVVSPEDDVEVRRITLINRSTRTRHLAVASYVELAMAPHRADRQHPAFHKLFVETEAVPDDDVLLGRRRPRHPDEAGMWVGHRLTFDGAPPGELTFETDRARFIGRGRGLDDPAGLPNPLSGTVGATLDPVLSLRREISLRPGERLTFSMLLGAAESRDACMALMEKYRQKRAIDRALELAWVRSQLELRQLRIQPDEARRYQQLASYMLYANARLRPSPERIALNQRGQAALWAYGISGDLPIALVTVADERDIGLVRQMLHAHTYWRQHGLKADLVVLSEEPSGYAQPLKAQLQRLAQAHAMYAGVDQPGGLFVRSSDQVLPEDVTLLHAVARVVLVAARGTLARQLGVSRDALEPRTQLVPRTAEPELPRRLPHVELQCAHRLGGFSLDGHEYVITLDTGDDTPAPWSNVIANPEFGTLVTEAGCGGTWARNSQRNRLTPWSNDPVLDGPSEVVYVRDEESGAFWTPTPRPVRRQGQYRARHGAGYSTFERNDGGIESVLTVFVPMAAGGGMPLRIARLSLRNDGRKPRRLSATWYAALVLGESREDSALHVVSHWDEGLRALTVRNRYNADFGDCVTFSSLVGAKPTSHTADRTEFLGRNGCLNAPAAMRQKGLSGRVGAALDPCAALQSTFTLAPGEAIEIAGILGQSGSLIEAREVLGRVRDMRAVDDLFDETKRWWRGVLGRVSVDVPEAATNLLLNQWLLYQTLSCRIFGRSAFYQSSGAFGFRDQLQDVMSVLHATPDVARDHILRAASRQFREGDVQHWWHPPSGAGVRTRISDDLLWLPYAVARYVEFVGDTSILDEPVPFLDGRALEQHEHEAYFVPVESVEHASLYEHCLRAIERSATAGPHGLPLIGAGDWNDGLNRVGIAGRGESVWLAWFRIAVLGRMAWLADLRQDADRAAALRTDALAIAARVEGSAWDGNHYLRAFFDNGTPIGASANPEASIDSLPQSWAWIAGGADPDRARAALEAAWAKLVRPSDGLVLLFTPPFDQWDVDPGYIKGYPPGVRENGGQYTHAAAWLAIAAVIAGDGDRAAGLLDMLSPVTHTSDEEAIGRYRVEPYAVAADVYALAGNVGRGGWTWYTGAAGWIYRAWIEYVLGLQVHGDHFTIDPVIPAAWPGFSMHLALGAGAFEIVVENPDGVQRGVSSITMDGRPVEDGRVPSTGGAAKHMVVVRMGRAGAP